MMISKQARLGRPVPRFAGLRQFAGDESGAITVDWVVLTAAIVGMGIAVIGAVGTGMINLGGEITSTLGEENIVSLDGVRAGDDPAGGDAEEDAAAPDDQPDEAATPDAGGPQPEAEPDRGPIRLIDRGPVPGRLPR